MCWRWSKEDEQVGVLSRFVNLVLLPEIPNRRIEVFGDFSCSKDTFLRMGMLVGLLYCDLYQLDYKHYYNTQLENGVIFVMLRWPNCN
jgi:hypothetical protein